MSYGVTACFQVGLDQPSISACVRAGRGGGACGGAGGYCCRAFVVEGFSPVIATPLPR